MKIASIFPVVLLALAVSNTYAASCSSQDGKQNCSCPSKCTSDYYECHCEDGKSKENTKNNSDKPETNINQAELQKKINIFLQQQGYSYAISDATFVEITQPATEEKGLFGRHWKCKFVPPNELRCESSRKR